MPLRMAEPVPSQTAQKSFFHHAATVCALSPLIIIGVLILGALSEAALSKAGWSPTPLPDDVAWRIGVAMMVFDMLAVLLGIIALFGIPKYGKKGILAKVLTGLILNLLFFSMVLP